MCLPKHDPTRLKVRNWRRLYQSHRIPGEGGSKPKDPLDADIVDATTRSVPLASACSSTTSAPGTGSFVTASTTVPVMGEPPITTKMPHPVNQAKTKTSMPITTSVLPRKNSPSFMERPPHTNN